MSFIKNLDRGSALLVVRAMIDAKSIEPKTLQELIIPCIEIDFSCAVQDLLADDRIDPGFNDDEILQRAVQMDRQSIVLILIQDRPSVIKKLDRGNAIVVVRAMIDSKSVKPKTLQELIIPCIELNFSCAVQDLLADDRIDPSFNDNDVLKKAVTLNHVQIVLELIQDDRVDPSVNDNQTLIWACINGHEEIVELLLKDPRVDPVANCNAPIIVATSSGHTKIVQMLLAKESVSAADNDCTIQLAAKKGHIDIVKLLLEVNKANKSNCQSALAKAIKYGHEEIVKLLLDHSVDVDMKFFIEKANEFDKPVIAKMLVEYQKKNVLAMLNSDLSLKEKQDYLNKFPCTSIRIETDLQTGEKKCCMVFKI